MADLHLLGQRIVPDVVVHRGHLDRLPVVPVRRGEGQRVPVEPEARRCRREADCDPGIGGRHEIEPHLIGPLVFLLCGGGRDVALLKLQRARADLQRRGVARVGDQHRHRVGARHRRVVVAVAGGGDAVGDAQAAPVARIVGVVVDAGDRHRLGRVPVAGRERQAGRRDRGGRDVAALDRDRHRAGGGLRVEHDGVGRLVLLRAGGGGVVGLAHGQAGRGDRHPAGVVVGDGDGHRNRGHTPIVGALAGSRDRVRDGDGALVIRVVDVVVDGRHGDGLGPVPVAVRERQAGRRDRGGRNIAALDRDRDRARGGLRVEHHCVGFDVLRRVLGRGIVGFVERQGDRGDRHALLIVIDDLDLQRVGVNVLRAGPDPHLHVRIVRRIDHGKRFIAFNKPVVDKRYGANRTILITTRPTNARFLIVGIDIVGFRRARQGRAKLEIQELPSPSGPRTVVEGAAFSGCSVAVGQRHR